jgi:hypothetical protein
MNTLKQDEVFPEWEPVPWDETGPKAEVQQQGFDARAGKALVWIKLEWESFPSAGIFGHDREWFMSRDIAFYTTCEGEDFILIRNTWHGFPDPPEWGLASRAAGTTQGDWSVWGCFPKLPKAWVVPGVSS